MKRETLLLLATAGLSACAAVPGGVPSAAVPPPLARLPAAGLERVLGAPAPALVSLFGRPDADVTEGAGRKLQFASDICVLDTYLYAPRSGGSPVVTYVDARQRTGAPIDRASCVSALMRRAGGR